jgi:hypothetical protein
VNSLNACPVVWQRRFYFSVFVGAVCAVGFLHLVSAVKLNIKVKYSKFTTFWRG